MKTKRIVFGVIALLALVCVISCKIPEELQDESTKEFVDPTKIKPPTDG